MNTIKTQASPVYELPDLAPCFRSGEIGLSGKMGVAVYCFHYAKAFNSSDYEQYALELIEEVQNMIDIYTPLGYANGLSGIGSVLCYLLREGFIEAGDEDIFSDIDQLISDSVCFERHRDLSRDTGLTGIGFYLLNRIKNQTAGKDQLQLSYVLLLVQNIMFAYLKMNGYTYPFQSETAITVQEICDLDRFFRQMLISGLCPELTKEALSIVEKSGNKITDIISILENTSMETDIETIRYYLEQIANSPEKSIKKHLASLHLQNMSLPRWWEIF